MYLILQLTYGEWGSEAGVKRPGSEAGSEATRGALTEELFRFAQRRSLTAH